MRLGIVYGVHGGHESLAVELGHSLEEDPIDPNRAYVFPGNEEAIEQGLRMVEENMAISIVNADPASPIYERHRAAKMLSWIATGQFDLVLDFHATPYVGESYAGIGLHTTNETIGVARLLQTRHLIVGNFGLPHVVNNALTIEMQADRSPEERQLAVSYWRQRIAELLEYESLEEAAEDHSSRDETHIWSYQNVITIDDVAAVEDQLTYDYADGSFIPISGPDVPLLGINPVVNGVRYTPYAINCGSSFERLASTYGEYVFHVGKTSPPDEWREFARTLSPPLEGWITPEMIRPAKVLAAQ